MVTDGFVFLPQVKVLGAFLKPSILDCFACIIFMSPEVEVMGALLKPMFMVRELVISLYLCLAH